MVLAVFRASKAVASMTSSGLNCDSNPDLCDSGRVLFQLSYQVNWERVVIRVDYEPVLIDMLPVGQIAPLVEHCTGIESTGFESPLRHENSYPLSATA